MKKPTNPRGRDKALRTLPVMVTGTEGMALRTTATPGRNSQRLHINCLPSNRKKLA